MLLCRVRKRGQCIGVHFVHAVDLTSQVCWRSEVHGDVDAADHQDSFLGFHLPGYVSSQFGGINLARFSAPPNVPTIQPAVAAMT